MSSTDSVSSDTAFKALALLLEDFKLKQQNRTGDTQTMNEPEPMRESLERKAQELELILSGFTYHVRHAISVFRHQHNTLALIHRLPIEILQYIFLLCASEEFFSQMSESGVHKENIRRLLVENSEEDDDDDRRSDHQDIDFGIALRLSQVCSRWYHVAVTQPQIWSYLATSFSQEATKLYLKRSKGTPIFITCPGDVNCVDERRFMKLVIPYLDRWKAFNSYSKNKNLLIDHLVEGPYSLPSLESFMIHSSGGADVELPFDLHERSPRLRELYAEWFRLLFQMGSEVLSGLTSLGIGCMFEDGSVFTIRDYELLFTSCPHLQTVFLHGVNDDPTELSMFSVKIPNLKSLYLYRLESGLLTTLLFSLFPNPSKLPIVKIIGHCDPDIAEPAFMNTSRAGSFMDLACRNMVRLSSTYEGAGYGLSQVWEESKGECSIVLEFAEGLEFYGSIVGSLFSPLWTSILRELSLTTCDDVAPNVAPYLYYCHRLEHLTITIKHQWSWLDRIINRLTHLAFPYGGITAPSTPGPQLKHLSLKEAGYDVLKRMNELLNARHEATQVLLMDSVLLRRLEKLDVHAFEYYTDRDKDTTLREVEVLLAARGITFEFVEV
ncbi:hypothetical protein FRC03_003712 [Tulasnella sp. 419]|nr:hypothetical protein FRC03_003712 [Tulasnella sp. 419]